MAPLPPDSTARLKIIYQNSFAIHSAIVRIASAGDASDAEATFSSVISSIGTLFNFTEVVGVQLAADGSGIFLDYAGTTLLGDSWGTDPTSAEHNATSLTFIGRSPLGRRARFSLFGYSGALSAFRLTAAENAGVDAAVDTLNAEETSWLAIDGGAPTWKPYVDIKANDHWVKASR